MPMDLPTRRPPSTVTGFGYAIGTAAAIAIISCMGLGGIWVLIYVIAHAVRTAWTP